VTTFLCRFSINRLYNIALSIFRSGTSVEIKSGHTEHASGIAAFEQQCKPYKVLLIGNSGIPWQEFLELEPLELFA